MGIGGAPTLLGTPKWEKPQHFPLFMRFSARREADGPSVSALGLPISLGGSIQCTSRLGDGTHLNANVNGVPLHGYIHAGGGLIAGWYRGQHHRPEYGEASDPATYYIGRFGQEIITRSRFLPPGDVESGSYNRICYSPERRGVPQKHTLQGNYACPCWACPCFRSVAVGIRKRACTVTDRTWPEPDWPCAPPHKKTSRLYDAV